MHRGANYILSLLGSSGTQATKSLSLTSTQAQSLASGLRDDAKDYFYSSCISTVDGVRGLSAGLYTWATVKLYYAAFYACRSILATDGICVFSLGKPHYSIESLGGAKCTEKERSTHAAVLGTFLANNPSHQFVTQRIENMSPLKWLKKRREACNYNIALFSEPGAPEHFAKVETDGVRRWISAYISDTSALYRFDKDHAMLALPLAVVIEAGNRIKDRGDVCLVEHQLRFISKKFGDARGQFSQITTLLRALAEA